MTILTIRLAIRVLRWYMRVLKALLATQPEYVSMYNKLNYMAIKLRTMELELQEENAG